MHTLINRLTLTINALTESISASGISRNMNISIDSVSRLEIFLKYPRIKLPKVISIDEFKIDVKLENTNAQQEIEYALEKRKYNKNLNLKILKHFI